MSKLEAFLNTAYIYFDFNAPIITNTTENILVDELPTINTVENITDVIRFNVYPNPSQGIINIIPQNGQDSYDVSVFDLSGKLIHIERERKDQIRFNLSDPGLYMIRIKSKSGAVIFKVFVED